MATMEREENEEMVGGGGGGGGQFKSLPVIKNLVLY